MEPRHWIWIQAAVIAAAIGVGTLIAVKIVNRPSPALAPVAALPPAPRPLAHANLPFVIPDVAPAPRKAPLTPNSGGAGREALASGAAVAPDKPPIGSGAAGEAASASASDPGGLGGTLRTAGDPLSSLKPSPTTASPDTAPGPASPAEVSPYAPAPSTASSVPGAGVGAFSPTSDSSATTPVTPATGP